MIFKHALFKGQRVKCKHSLIYDIGTIIDIESRSWGRTLVRVEWTDGTITWIPAKKVKGVKSEEK